MSDEHKPYVEASRTLPEFTLQAVLLGLVLSLVMAAANAYVGLYAGMTVSAAIPASVISMGVLRGLLKRGTILENNVVHTTASSGESLAAGIIFTLPALILLGIWDKFDYLDTTLIALAGGLMGVVMMIPLRRAMVIEQKELRFPEGVACAEVLKAGDKGGTEMLGIFAALGFGGLFKVLVDVVGLFKGTVEGAVRVGRTALYAGTDISPMLMAVGFIVGWEVSLLIFLGGAVSFVGALPVLGWGADLGGGTLTDGLMGIWDAKIRFFGIGAMVVGGVYSILKILGSIAAAVRTAVHSIRGLEDVSAQPRTERSISGKLLFGLLGACLVLSTLVYYRMTDDPTATGLTAVVMFVLAFFFVAVASYIAGLVGSSNSPVSGMTICTVMVTAGLLLMLGYTGKEGMLATLGVAGVVCCAACTSGDICQDLKIAHILGATPRRVQLGEILGTIAAAFIMAPVLQLLHNAYGIGKGLKAPQAVMFEKLVGGLFGAAENIPWDLVGWGALVGVLAIVVDRIWLEPRDAKFRLHVMPLAVGMYLPWTVTFPILLGGIAYVVVDARSRRRGDDEARRARVIHRGLLFASGLVAGEAILGIAIAFLRVSGVEKPLLETWATKGGTALELVSLAGLALMIALLIAKALGRREARA
jgi:putative OPT family oligopeptide transporter